MKPDILVTIPWQIPGMENIRHLEKINAVLRLD